MKQYEVITDIFSDYIKGDIIFAAPGGFNQEELENNSQWFRPVPDLKVGDWIVYETSFCSNAVVLITQICNKTMEVNMSKHGVLQTVLKKDYIRHATDEEIEKELISRAEKRYTNGDQYKGLRNKDAIGIYHKQDLKYDSTINSLTCKAYKQKADMVWCRDRGWAEKVSKPKIRDYVIQKQPDDNNMYKIGCETLNLGFLSIAAELCRSHDIQVILEGDDVTEDIINNF